MGDIHHDVCYPTGAFENAFLAEDFFKARVVNDMVILKLWRNGND